MLRCSFELAFTVLAIGAGAASLPQADTEFLRDLTKDVIQASSVPPGSNGGGSWHLTNSCGFTLITPGKDTYPAFWIRDFSMAADSGLIPAHMLRQHLLLVCKCQNGATERKLKHELRIPPWAIPDHINYDGVAAFFPGSYGSGDDQGDGTCGRLPPIDDHYEFIHIAWLLWKKDGHGDFLNEQVNGVRVFERLEKAFASPVTEAETGLAFTREEERAVGFGFCDAEVHTGKLLTASVLRFRAAGELAELAHSAGQQSRAADFEQVRDQIRSNIMSTFGGPAHPGAWLHASTGISAQPDVWGTLLALHLKIPDDKSAAELRKTIADAVRSGKITYLGAVRHVPLDMDCSKTTSWERSIAPLNSYQNGAYWHTASGWLIEALLKEDIRLAQKIFTEMIDQFRTDDFRKGKGHGAPWEDIGPGGSEFRNAVYLASVALPYAILSAQGRQVTTH